MSLYCIFFRNLGTNDAKNEAVHDDNKNSANSNVFDGILSKPVYVKYACLLQYSNLGYTTCYTIQLLA